MFMIDSSVGRYLLISSNSALLDVSATTRSGTTAPMTLKDGFNHFYGPVGGSSIFPGGHGFAKDCKLHRFWRVSRPFRADLHQL